VLDEKEFVKEDVETPLLVDPLVVLVVALSVVLVAAVVIVVVDVIVVVPPSASTNVDVTTEVLAAEEPVVAAVPPSENRQRPPEHTRPDTHVELGAQTQARPPGVQLRCVPDAPEHAALTATRRPIATF